MWKYCKITVKIKIPDSLFHQQKVGLTVTVITHPGEEVFERKEFRVYIHFRVIGKNDRQTLARISYPSIIPNNGRSWVSLNRLSTREKVTSNSTSVVLKFFVARETHDRLVVRVFHVQRTPAAVGRACHAHSRRSDVGVAALVNVIASIKATLTDF